MRFESLLITELPRQQVKTRKAAVVSVRPEDSSYPFGPRRSQGEGSQQDPPQEEQAKQSVQDSPLEVQTVADQIVAKYLSWQDMIPSLEKQESRPKILCSLNDAPATAVALAKAHESIAGMINDQLRQARSPASGGSAGITTTIMRNFCVAPYPLMSPYREGEKREKQGYSFQLYSL